MGESSIRILLVEDNPGDARLIREMLNEAEAAKFDLELADRLSKGLEHLSNGNIDLVLLDLGLPDSQGLDTFQKMSAQALEVPVVVLTGVDDEERAVKAVGMGAQDYLVKGEVDGTLLARAIRYAIERKRMEEELKRHSEHLEELVEERTRELKKAERLAAIGETAALVGHDLRNPLQGIVGIVYLLKRKLKREGKLGAEEALDKVEEQVWYMDKIVSDLQDYAKPLGADRVETSIPQLIDKVLSKIEVPENIKVNTTVDKKLPMLMVDPIMMNRVFTNLILNAVQAMPDGGRLTIRVSKKGGTAPIIVQDTGIGIAKKNLDKLFNPLFTTKAKGQGFGLPVCKRLVEAHDGDITVKSTVGEGSTFTVELPFGRKGEK